MDFILKQQYYNKPEGEDYMGKMVVTNKYMFVFAAPAAVCDVLMYSHPKGVLATAACLGKWLGPAALMASAFTTGVYASHALRGKDDM
jgi:NADH dehydrogenase (ubiquinone) 1 alpha subcomplex subunit 11